MAVGARDQSMGVPAMKTLQAMIRGCPDPMVVPDAGHFARERGQAIARAALDAFATRG